jgi:lipoprotein-anchoring transpeptidase ErfK/SrfK
MRQTQKSFRRLWVLVVGLAASLAASAAQGQGSCEQIKAVCEDAGFVQGAASAGIGLQVDCIIPIMQGTGQRSRARKPLPKVDPQLVADCAGNHPRFGRPNAPQTEAALQPAPASPPLPGISNPNSNSRQAHNVGRSEPSASQEDTVRPATQNRQAQSSVISALPPEEQPETGPVRVPLVFRRTMIGYSTQEPAGTIVIDTPNTYLYLVLGNGKAIRYGIGVGREGFTWAGTERISRMAEWPDWYPPSEMIDRQPYLPRFMAGGEGNPLGARALYLGNTLYRIHGTNQPSTIGTFVSSGCIRLTNDDITDLYGRIQVGTRVVVLPGRPSNTAQATSNAPNSPSAESSPIALPSGRTR